MPWVAALSPSRSGPRRMTTSVAFGTLTMIPLPALVSTPASKPSEEMVIGLPIVTAPNPPGSRTLISPPAAVLEIAPAKVLHGAVRLHGFASSPTPETHVRVACACAVAEKPITRTAVPRNRRILEVIIWIVGLFEGWIARHLREALRLCNLPGGRQANFAQCFTKEWVRVCHSSR